MRRISKPCSPWPSRRWVPWMVRTSRSVRNAVWAAQWFFVSSLNEAFSAAISQGFNMFQPHKKGGWTMTYHGNDWNGVRDSENLRNVGGIWLPICETYVQCTVRSLGCTISYRPVFLFQFLGLRTACNAAVDASVVQRLGKMASWQIIWFSCLESNKLVNPIRRDVFFFCNSNQCVFRPWCLSSFYWCFCNSDVYCSGSPVLFYNGSDRCFLQQFPLFFCNGLLVALAVVGGKSYVVGG